MRGKLSAGSYLYNSPGITPAGAGKTLFKLVAAKAAEDHPRRCGENEEAERALVCVNGSPPQVRGKPFPFLRVRAGSRITPAGAGKTKTPTSAVLLARDHPRRCGENTKSMEEIAVSLGSPPQVRGKQRFAAEGKKAGGITPAGAGKTPVLRNG